MNKLEKLYSENTNCGNTNGANGLKSTNKNPNFNPDQIEDLINQNFNYNLVYNNIDTGKKENDPFSFVNDMLKPKKI